MRFEAIWRAALILIFVVSTGYVIFGLFTTATANTPVLIASILTGVFSIVQGVDYVRDRLIPDRRHMQAPRPHGTQSASEMINSYLDGKLREFASEEKLFVPLSGETHIDTQYSTENQTFDDIQQATTRYDGRFVLIGDPGAGKSTTLKDLMRRAIREYKANPTEARLPVWINLGVSSNPADARKLLEYWWAHYCYLPGTAEQYLRLNNLALFLDGLNEMPDQVGKNSRKSRAESLKTFLADFPDLPVIVTCRVGDYEIHELPIAIWDESRWDESRWAGDDEIIHNRTDKLEIRKDKLDLGLPIVIARELDEARMEQMITKRGADAGLMQKIKVSEANSALRRMAANPYNLTMLIDIYQRDKQIPASLNELYGRFVREAHERNQNRRQQGETLTDLVRSDWEKLEAALKRLAYLMIVKGKGTAAEYAWAQKQIGDLGENGAPAVEPLIMYLRDDDWRIRGSTAGALGKIGDARAVEPLITALRDEGGRWRSSADALGWIGYDHALEPLIAALRDNTAVALGKIGVPAIDPLIAALCDKDKRVRSSAAVALGKIGAPAIDPLIAVLHDEDEDVRNSAADALGQIGAPAVEHLVATMHDKHDKGWWGRYSAADAALRHISDPRAVEPLIAALRDEDVNVRRSTAYALGEISDARAIEPLITVLSDGDEHELVRRLAVYALRKINTPEARQALKDAGLE